MQLSLITAIDSLALTALLYLLLAYRGHRRRRGRPYPPGPPPWPVIGNFLDVPKLSPWLAYANMSKKYGQVVVVLCSPTAIKDLLERRGELYADRTQLPIFEIMGVDWAFFLARMGKYWREGRKFLDRGLRPGAAALHRHLIEEKTRVFLGQLLATPNAFREHINLLVPLPHFWIIVDSRRSLQGKLVMRLTYGYDLKENDDILGPSKRIVRRLPSWVPWFKYEPLASECRELARRVKKEPIDFVRNSMVDLLNGLERRQMAQTIEDILGSLFQEVQKRAQAELDSVISRDRLPTYDDKPRLPYIEAMSRELLRWQMVTPLGVRHAPTDDNFYKGYFIPKGAVVIANAWAVLHDPELYPDPEAFKPDRFLDKDGTFRDDPMISLAFGAGRRICPGRHIVDTILFVVTASVLSVFNVTTANDENGKEIPVTLPAPESIEVAGVIYPPEFECSITPRDKLAEDLIRASALA
ncbi:cytochrome P450 [Lactarius hatsudake]|nr:cytochrome P450 [Lactarius hatsudake]